MKQILMSLLVVVVLGAMGVAVYEYTKQPVDTCKCVHCMVNDGSKSCTCNHPACANHDRFDGEVDPQIKRDVDLALIHPIYLDRSANTLERAAIKVHLETHGKQLENRQAGNPMTKILAHPLALRVLENHVHRLMASDAKLQKDLADYKLSEVGQTPTPPSPDPLPTPAPKHPLLLWLWEHKDQILAFVLQILKLFHIG